MNVLLAATTTTLQSARADDDAAHADAVHADDAAADAAASDEIEFDADDCNKVSWHANSSSSVLLCIYVKLAWQCTNLSSHFKTF